MKNAQQFGSPDATLTANAAPSSLSGSASVAKQKRRAAPARYLGPGVKLVYRGRSLGETPCATVMRRCEACRRSDLYCACAS
jgi:hypothetical protein